MITTHIPDQCRGQVLHSLTPHFSAEIAVIKYIGFSHDSQLFPMRWNALGNFTSGLKPLDIFYYSPCRSMGLTHGRVFQETKLLQKF